MKERPILFNGEMVRAILDGRKTQTRRVIKYISDLGDPDRWCHKLESVNAFCGDFRRYCPYGQPGDRLWVRETWGVSSVYDDLPPSKINPGAKVAYHASGGTKGVKKRPSIHMPRWASRITLEVTDVRVERVQEISEEDASAEGVKVLQTHVVVPFSNPVERIELNHRNYFAALWDDINHKRGFGWDKNPWVWVVEFKKGQTDDQR